MYVTSEQINAFTEEHERTVTEIRQHLQKEQQEMTDNLVKDYKRIGDNMEKQRIGLQDEVQGVEATLRLDYSLDRQRFAEELKAVFDGKEMQSRANQTINKVRDEMAQEGWRAVYGMAGFFGSMIGLVIWVKTR